MASSEHLISTPQPMGLQHFPIKSKNKFRSRKWEHSDPYPMFLKPSVTIIPKPTEYFNNVKGAAIVSKHSVSLRISSASIKPFFGLGHSLNALWRLLWLALYIMYEKVKAHIFFRV